MKIYISADMEGISGVIHGEHTVKGTGDYERGRRLLTEEVNAAIQGALDAGADEVLVNDAHGSMRNIIIEDLNPEAKLVTGFPKPMLMMEGIDKSFDGAVFIGYHAKASSIGVLAHTINGAAFESIKINGVEFGETGINGAIAGCYGVPVLAVSGDNKLKEEVATFIPDAEFAEVKTVHGRNAANCISPAKARQLIREKVKNAVLNIKKFKTYELKGQLELEITLNSVVQTDIAAIVPGAKRISPKTVVFKVENVIEAMNVISTISNATCVLFIDIYK